MRKVLLAMLCLAGPALAQAAGIPLAPFVAEYDVRYGSMPVGSSRTEVGHGTVPEHWFIETRSSASGFARLIASGTLVQRSDFALDGATILPLRYRFDDGSRRSSKAVAPASSVPNRNDSELPSALIAGSGERTLPLRAEPARKRRPRSVESPA